MTLIFEPYCPQLFYWILDRVWSKKILRKISWKEVFCCWWCSKWTLKVLWEIDKKSWKEGVEISCVASLSIPIGMTKWTIPFYDKINLGTASQNGTFFSLGDMTMPHFFRVLNSNIAITKCIFSHSPFCIAFDIRTKLYAGATPLWIKIKSKNTNRLFFQSFTDSKQKKLIFIHAQCLKITEKVSFNIASEASLLHCEWTKVDQKCQNWSIFNLVVKQCYQIGLFY